MMQALDKDLRSALEKTVKAARTVAETAAHAAVEQLGVGHDKPEAFLGDAEKALRNRLRTHGKQLGDTRDSKSTNPTYGKQEVQHLVQEVGYKNGLKLNAELATAEAWSVKQIDARTTTLVDQVVSLFAMTEGQPCA